jgi:Cu+-exporting ATPase
MTTPTTPNPHKLEVVDPVCKMTIEPSEAAGKFDYHNHAYYFCSKSCLERFRADPESFLRPDANQANDGQHNAEVEYTCRCIQRSGRGLVRARFGCMRIDHP